MAGSSPNPATPSSCDGSSAVYRLVPMTPADRVRPLTGAGSGSHPAFATLYERLEALLAEQSALRRVATLVAADPEPRRLFDSVCEELGRVLGVDSTDMLRYEEDRTATVVGAWTVSGAPSFPVGTSVPVEARP